ncbi:hypothetical protein A3K29_05865 [Candidatus Collierbacteria bacterium RIFOXYB2_FULL_46_14]|nr:MAG: hypothetical protein A3K29_05865 [Candidatus Collierbacteria bacterium RIFOXYB2_FULL_46_14]OGD76658.1 MAG: hypothetical protein A3K43_05865 [Candidatus Collierbacteria bacterium RIFOXYA2_FULL_46_20]OGD77994.1 MAG: hypothetical protein A3K39_05865 [Candidatus Collierbacteria bacterium RIFOXYC2_FULL_43_15]OGD80018.1 MAG: hypothetical protein A2320_00295 [Pseudomonadales bacterium GWC2_63_15]OGD82716.1 MAG: hypothetical protein A3K36_05865 [Candidatus Collierbacteria bacterium RIFOXYD2_FUL
MEKLKVTVRNKTDVLLETECFSVSMANEIGPFDILAEHANFVSIFSGEIVVGRVSGQKWKTKCERGIVRVVGNVVDVVILEE